ncbi:MAG: DMT family transporter [Lachnospiraceae bacterium]|nr:DMT family transporter [Lachnospiraceae bacterium]
MFYFLSLLSGALISIMITLNGRLAGQHGLHSATTLIHLIGLLLIATMVLIKKERPFSNRQAWFLYLGGAIGVLITVFQNLAFGRISVSAILALVLLGQAVAGLVVDQFGFFHMPKHPFTKQKLFGLFLILAGIVSMINNFELLAIILTFLSGICLVIARSLNARLAILTSVHTSTFFNYVIGLAVSIPVLLLLGFGEISTTTFDFSSEWYIYLGGIVGVVVIFISNIIVVKISAFYLTLLLFIGQVFTGILIDVMLTGVFSHLNLIGGILVLAGLCTNLLLDRQKKDSAIHS